MALNIFQTNNNSSGFATKSKKMARMGAIGAFFISFTYASFTCLFTDDTANLLMAFSLPAACIVFYAISYLKISSKSIYNLLLYLLIVSACFTIFIGYQLDFEGNYSLLMMVILNLMLFTIPTNKKLAVYFGVVFSFLIVCLLLSTKSSSFIGLIVALFLFSFILSFILTLQRRNLIRTIDSNASILKSIANTTNDAFLLVDYFSKEIKDANERTSQIFALNNAKDIIKTNYQTLFADDHYIPQHRTEIKQQITDYGYFSDEIQFKNKSGEIFWGHLTLSPFNAAKNNYYLLQIRNIDAKKKYDEKIAKNNAKYRFILDNLDEFIYLANYAKGSKPDFEYVSPFIEEIFGIKPHQNVSQEIQEKVAQLYHPEDIPKIKSEKDQMFKDKTNAVFNYRVKPLGKSAYIWIQEKVFPRLDENGNIIEILGILRKKED